MWKLLPKRYAFKILGLETAQPYDFMADFQLFSIYTITETDKAMVMVVVFQLLKALTTEKCQERFSLERLEVLGDAFLKFSVGRHLFLQHHALDEGGLTGKRSSIVNNSNLCKLAVKKNLQVIEHF